MRSKSCLSTVELSASTKKSELSSNTTLSEGPSLTTLYKYHLCYYHTLSSFGTWQHNLSTVNREMWLNFLFIIPSGKVWEVVWGFFNPCFLATLAGNVSDGGSFITSEMRRHGSEALAIVIKKTNKQKPFIISHCGWGFLLKPRDWFYTISSCIYSFTRHFWVPAMN